MRSKIGMTIIGVLIMQIVAGQEIADSCSIHRTTDIYTKEKKVSSGFIKLQNAQVSIEAGKAEIDFFFTVSGECYNDQSMAMVYLENVRSPVRIKNTGSMNCDGTFHFIFKNTTITQANLKRLTTNKITQIVFKNSNDKEKIIAITAAQQQMLFHLSNCVLNEAKELIKK